MCMLIFMAPRKQKTNIVKRDNKIVNMAYVGLARAYYKQEKHTIKLFMDVVDNFLI